MSIILFNTLSKSKELFTPIVQGEVRIYACGPTVYNYAHIGNLRTYIFEDLLRRTFARASYKVKHVMNITDVGHLQSDADEGEDKMAIAAKRESKTPWEIARYYEGKFFEDCKRLEILSPDVICRATEHIDEMISFILGLEKRGFTYRVGGNVYFDTSKFPSYRDFAKLPDTPGINRVAVDERKKSPSDFVLWFGLDDSKFPNQAMKWESPWGIGFPGWHIECSAMATKELGKHFDIHCGGIDHVPVHHTNEIAQSESLHGQKWVNYWLHGEFLNIENSKMSKSKGEVLTLSKLASNGFLPISFRYLCLTAHYRSHLTFTNEALSGAENSYRNLCSRVETFRQGVGSSITGRHTQRSRSLTLEIDNAMRDDLNSPKALSILFDVSRKQELTDSERLAIFEDADSALGLSGFVLYKGEITEEEQQLINQRNYARLAMDWNEADRLRDILLSRGIKLRDRPEGTVWRRG